MELLLALRVPERDTFTSVDVVLDVDPSDAIADVATVLARYAESRGYGPFDSDRMVLSLASEDRPLDPARRVAETNLLSGQTVVLGPAGQLQDRPGDTARAVVSLDIATGPEAGRFLELLPGRYRIGRSSGCDIVISDPTMSKHHLTVDIAPDLTVVVTPVRDTSNGTFSGGVEIVSARRVAPDELLQVGGTALAFRPLGEDFSQRRDLLGQLPFNRVPHHRIVVKQRKFEPLARPPEEPRTASFPLLAALLPLVAGVAMAVLLQQPRYLIFTALSPIMLAGRYMSDRRGGRVSYTKSKAEFLQRVEARAAEITEAIAEEQAERFRSAPDVAELARQARFHHGGLWLRQRQDPDFMTLRVGLGDLDSKVTAEIERGGDPALREHAEAALAHQRIVHSVPLTVSLEELKVLGLYGDEDAVRGLGTSLVTQAACLHSPEDLVIAAAIPEGKVGDYTWLKWLPHVRSATSPLEGDHLAVGPERSTRLLVNLLGVADDRIGRQADREGRAWPRVVVVLHEDAQPDRAVMSQLLDVAEPAGMAALWIGHAASQLPRQSRATVMVTDPTLGNRSKLRFTDPDHVDRDFEVEGVRTTAALDIARSLAPIRDASAATVTTALPRRVLLLDLLAMPEPNGSDLAARWRTPQPYGISGPLGIAADGPFHLDLVADGPHALIAGTSGSGKSELLQTFVGSLSSSYSPERLNFLFIDYKGGASSAEFRELPHSVGYVTNLDGRQSIRALTSLRAELSRRMEVLEGRAKDLAEMLRVAPDDAPPSLVIVVDEFATLVKEIPDFVVGIVDIAQRGRSLGIHLVLATQRPAGAVNDNILANTNLRIALRVVDPADSVSVIGSKEAADIPVPLRGRAYARLGPRLLVGFQCAWSGAEYRPRADARAIGVRSFTFGHMEVELGDTTSAAVATERDDAGTQLQALVTAAAEAAAVLDLAPARRPWLEPLEPVIPLDGIVAGAGEPDATDPGRTVVLGMIDDPERQAQRPVVVDLEAGGGLLIFGTGGAGKTTALRTIAAGLALQGSADAVQLYALDFASRALGQLTPLPHCAAVANGDDPERVTRIITVLEDELVRRRSVLARANAETLGALRQTSGDLVVPRIVVLVDGYGGFQAAFDKPDTYEWVNRFQRLVSDGRQVGIHAVVTSDRRAGVPSGLFSAISTRLVLRMADAEEMGVLGVPSKIAKDADLISGRGFLGSAEIQIACVGSDPAGVAQAEALRQMGTDLATRSDARAAAPPDLPESIARMDLASATGHLRIPVAVADLTLETRAIDLSRGHVMVTGPPQSGKSTGLATLASGLRAIAPEVRLIGIGSTGSPLADLAVWDDAAFDRKKQARAFEDLVGMASEIEHGDVQAVVFIDEAPDIDDAHTRVLETLTNLDAVRLAVALDPGVLSRAFSGWIGALRRNRSLLVLQPESRSEVEQLANVKVRFRPGQEFPPGRGVLVGGRSWDLVQVAES